VSVASRGPGNRVIAIVARSSSNVDALTMRLDIHECRAVSIAIAAAITLGCGAGDDASDGADATTTAASSDAGNPGSQDAGQDGGPSGDGGGAPPIGSSACELGIAITGALTWSTPSTPACGIPFGPQTGIFMGYLFLDGAIEAVQIEVGEVTEGATGTFPASLTLTHADGRAWTSEACMVTIATHVAEPELDDEFSRAYRVQGTGTCTQPATDEAGTESVDVAPFQLRFPARWA
jgi:hypothetical protein